MKFQVAIRSLFLISTAFTISQARAASQVTYTEVPAKRESALIKEIIEWEPLAKPAFHNGPLGQCQPHKLRDRILSNSTKNKPLNTKEEVEACLSKWEVKSARIGDMISLTSIEYNFVENRSFKYLKIKLPNGKVVRGIMGIKDDPRPRPLVIAVCGVMCEAGDRTATYMLMKFFDESPFHVLVLGNHTSKDFIEDNQIGGLGGGINAGDTLVKLAKDLRSEHNPLSTKISNIFLYGLSLGGHEVLYASYLHQKMVELGGMPVIDGVALNSPVVDFPATIQRLTTKPVVKQIYNRVLSGLFHMVSALIGFDLEAASDQLVENKDGFQMNTELFYANQTAYQKRFPRTEDWEIPDFDDPQKLLEFAKFQNLAADTKLPVFAIASLNDPIVRPLVNSAILNKDDLNDRYSMLIAKQGTHMAAALAYGWRNISMAYQSYFLSLAPEFTRHLRTYSLPLPDLSNWSTGKILKKKKARIVSLGWKPEIGSSKVELQIVVTNFTKSEPPNCQEELSANPMACTTSLGIPMDLAHFPTSIRVPQSKAELAALTRWLNVQVELVDSDGNNPVDSQKLPTRASYMEL